MKNLIYNLKVNPSYKEFVRELAASQLGVVLVVVPTVIVVGTLIFHNGTSTRIEFD